MICLIGSLLCRIIIVQDHCCAVPLLYSVIVVYNRCCVASLLCRITVVQYHCCVESLLCSITVVQYHYCVVSLLRRTTVVQYHCCVVPLLRRTMFLLSFRNSWEKLFNPSATTFSKKKFWLKMRTRRSNHKMQSEVLIEEKKKKTRALKFT